MEKQTVFKTYNQVNKLFKVVVMSIGEVINNPKLQDKSCLVLFNKPTIDTPKHPKHRTKTTRELIADLQQESKSTRQLLLNFIKKQEEFNQLILTRIDRIDGRLDNIVKLNNLKE